MPLPAIMAGIGLGSKLLGGLFSGKSKAAEAKAMEKNFNVAESKKREAAQVNRQERGNLIINLLRGLMKGRNAGFSGYGPGSGGATSMPDYSISPEMLAGLQNAPAYTEAPYMGPQSAGSGWGTAANLFGSAGDIANLVAMGQKAQSPGPGATADAAGPCGGPGQRGCGSY